MLERFFERDTFSESTKGIIAILVGSLFIAIGPFVVEFSSVSAETNTFYRLLLGTVFFGLWILRKGQMIITAQRVMLGLVCGGLLVLDLFLWNQSIQLLGAGISTLLANVEVLFLVLLGSLFFHEKFPENFRLLSLCIIGGIVALLLPIFPTLTADSSLGVITALSASFSYALYLFCMKFQTRIAGGQKPEEILSLVSFFGAFLLGVGMCFQGGKGFVLPNLHVALLVFLNGLCSQVVAWWLIAFGLARLSLTMSGILLLVQPALTYFLDCAFLGRNTQFLQLFGASLLLGAVFFTTQANQMDRNDNKSIN